MNLKHLFLILSAIFYMNNCYCGELNDGNHRKSTLLNCLSSTVYINLNNLPKSSSDNTDHPNLINILTTTNILKTTSKTSNPISSQISLSDNNVAISPSNKIHSTNQPNSTPTQKTSIIPILNLSKIKTFSEFQQNLIESSQSSNVSIQRLNKSSQVSNGSIQGLSKTSQSSSVSIQRSNELSQNSNQSATGSYPSSNSKSISLSSSYDEDSKRSASNKGLFRRTSASNASGFDDDESLSRKRSTSNGLSDNKVSFRNRSASNASDEEKD